MAGLWVTYIAHSPAIQTTIARLPVPMSSLMPLSSSFLLT